MNAMKNSHKGQTLVETVLVLMLLFILFFGIAEIARAWWYKSQLNNAARIGVRVAIVDTTLTTPQASSLLATCSYSGNTCAPSTAGSIQNATCGAITNGDLCGTSQVFLTVTGVDSSGNPPGTIVSPGGIINVRVTGTFTSVIPGLTVSNPGGFGWTSIFSFLASRQLEGQSTMRHE
jgi:Flp pilus assembly protein TadG